jgi:hypothetical protein
MGIPATKKDGDCVSLFHPSHPPTSLLTINRRLCDLFQKGCDGLVWRHQRASIVGV